MVHRLASVVELLKQDNMARHFVMMAGFGFASGVFNYLYQLAMGRMLQPGDFSTLGSLANLFMIVTVLGITIRSVITKFASKYHAENNLGAVGYLWRVYQKRLLIFGSIAFIFVAALSPQISGFLKIGNPWYPLVLFLSLTLAFALPLNYGTLNGLHRFISVGLATSLWPLLRLVLAVVLIKIGLGLYGSLAPFVLSFIIVFLVTYYMLRSLPEKGKDKVEVLGIRSYVSLSFVAILAYTMLTFVDVVLVKHFFSDTEAANYPASNYTAIAALGRVSLFAPMGIAFALFPKTSGLHELGKSHRPILLMAALFTTLLTGLVVVVYWLFPNFVVDLLGPGKYTLAAPYLFRYSLAMMFFAISYIFMNYFLSINVIKIAYIFAAVAFLQVLLILYFHGDIAQVVNDVLISGAVCLFVTLIFYLWCQRTRCPIVSDTIRNN